MKDSRAKDNPAYVVWQSIKTRCYNQRHPSFMRYGARGVEMDPEWKASFPAFLRGVGERPSFQHSIDRYPDQNGSYVPGNVRWATRSEQGCNKSNNLLILWRGETLPLAEIARRTGCEYHRLYNDVRIFRHSIEDAVKRQNVPQAVTA